MKLGQVNPGLLAYLMNFSLRQLLYCAISMLGYVYEVEHSMKTWNLEDAVSLRACTNAGLKWTQINMICRHQ